MDSHVVSTIGVQTFKRKRRKTRMSKPPKTRAKTTNELLWLELAQQFPTYRTGNIPRNAGAIDKDEGKVQVRDLEPLKGGHEPLTNGRTNGRGDPQRHNSECRNA